MEQCATKLSALAILLVIASCFVDSHAEDVRCQIDTDCGPKKCGAGFVPICRGGICVCKLSVHGSSCDKPEDCRYICGHPNDPQCFTCAQRKCVCLCF
ncbi:hypothetical protein NL676_010441 [Syzygium grande]|nr:hypothetical protein NL676_010441 [Syzygium grande]